METPEMRDRDVYTIGVGTALLHSTSAILAQTAVGLCLLAHFRGEPKLEMEQAIKLAHEWLVESRAILKIDIATPIGKPDS